MDIEYEIHRLVVCAWAYEWSDKELESKIRSRIIDYQLDNYFKREEDRKQSLENLIFEIKNRDSFDICILKEPANGYLPKSIAFYNYTHYKYQHTGSITSKTLELLIFHEWVKIDHSKSSQYKYYYFITEKGKAASNGENKET